MNTNSTQAWFAVFVLAIFCTGAGVGVLADRFLSRPPGRPPEGRPGPPGGPPGGPRGQGPGRGPSPLGPRDAVDRLLEELQLSPAQRATFDQLMSARRDRLDQFYQDVQSRFEAEQRDLRAAIREALTPEQQQRFDEWVGRQPPPPGLLGGPRGRRGGPPPGREGRN